jgi:hypothetical protein
MREEFLALFRDTQRHPPQTASTSGPSSASAGRETSRYLRRFLQRETPEAKAAPSGLASLDHLLGGGFGPGLHLVLGLPGSGKTAFLESVAWEAVSVQRPVVYYPLKLGSLRAWENLIITLASIMGGPPVPRSVFRARVLTSEETDTLTRLDLALQASVFPHLSLIDSPRAPGGTLSTFIEGVRFRSREIGELQGKVPLLLLDDLDALLELTGARSRAEVLRRLDDALAAESIPGLLAATPTDPPFQEEQSGGRTVILLTRLPSSEEKPSERVDLEVRRNPSTGRTGRIPLLLDHRSGLFAELDTRG